MSKENVLIVDGKGTERVVYQSPQPEPSPIKRPETPTFQEAIDWNKLHQKHTEKGVSFTQEQATVIANPTALSNRIHVVNVADLHFGHMDVDYDFLNRGLQTIEDTPNMFAVMTWNLLDASIPAKFPDGVMWNSMTAQEQVYSFREKLLSLHEKGKILGAIGDASCHEGWSKQATGWMIYRELFEGIDVPLLLNGGYLDVVCGEQKYRIGLFHKTRYWSSLNKGHGGERMMDRTADCDIVFTSHLHRAVVERTVRYNEPHQKNTAVISSGTCKLHDKFFRSNTGEDGEPGFQGVTLWADRNAMEGVFDIESAREGMIDAIKEEEAKKIQEVLAEIKKFKS